MRALRQISRPLSKLALTSKPTPASSLWLSSMRSMGTNWVPTQDDLLQKLNTTALVHEVSLQQMEMASVVVPWFMKNMPVSFYEPPWLSVLSADTLTAGIVL
jgi:hypothetical protein